jgi:hypothetical protein
LTLVEALTQQLPLLKGSGHGDPVVPSTLPSPFREIADHCLRLDPEERWKVSQIAANLREAPTTPVEKERIRPPAAPSKWRSFTVAGAIVLVAILAISRIRDRRPKSEAGARVAVESSETQSKAQAPSSGPNVKATKVADSAVASTPGKVVQQVVPEVARSARNTIQGHIRVTVKASVNSSGNVVGTKLMIHGPSRYFARLAQQAAQRSTFRPPQVEGRNVASQWTLSFEFSRAATNAHSTQTSP